jgi:hypothetical protein
MTYRTDLDALRARHDALEREVEARRHELLDARRMIDEVERRAHLPVLDDIRVAAPCSADWAKMTGDERVRACGDCNKNVYNLSDMTREEAEALILEKEGRLCVRYYRRTDGTILFGDCAIGVKRRRRRRAIAGAAALLAATGAVAYGATRTEDAASERGRHVMGGLAADLPTAPVRGTPSPDAMESGPVTMGLVTVDLPDGGQGLEQLLHEEVAGGGGGGKAGGPGHAGGSR